MLRQLRRAALVVALTLIAPLAAEARPALVAVAANYAGAVAAIAEAFTRDTGHAVQITTGATGKLYAQITQGAPFHVLLAADAATPARIEAEGLGVPGTRFTYAIGHLTLYSADPARIGADPASALLAPDVRHIAIANPDLAPYGVAAREAMQAMGVWDAVRGKIVMGQNIGQTFSMVETGAAQLGFVATSALAGPGAGATGSRHDIPQALFTPIAQDAILLVAGADNAAARAFLEYLRTDTAVALARAYGYGTD